MLRTQQTKTQSHSMSTEEQSGHLFPVISLFGLGLYVSVLRGHQCPCTYLAVGVP